MSKSKQAEPETAEPEGAYEASPPFWTGPIIPDLTPDELAACIRSGGFAGVRMALAKKFGNDDCPDLAGAASAITSILDGFHSGHSAPDPAAVVRDIRRHIETLAIAAKAAGYVAPYIASGPGQVVNATGHAQRYFDGQTIPEPRKWGGPAIRTGVDPRTGESDPPTSVGTQYYGQGA